MLLTILLIVILGISIGVIAFFIIRSIVAPKKVITLANLYRQGKTAGMIRMAKNIIAKEPRNSEAHYFLGLAYLGESRPELAMMEFKTVNQIGQFSNLCPEDKFRQQIAELYARFNQPEEALKEYLLLIKRDPSNADYYFKSGELFEERDKSEKALMYYRKTIELDGRHSDAHYRLGYLLYRGKKFVEAKNELQIAVKFQPNNYKAYFFLGRLQKENHDYTAALITLERAQRDPDYKIKALVERGSCYMSMKNYDKAISELERAVKLSQDEASTETLYGRYFLGLCYEKLRKIENAISQWEKVYAKKPSFRDVAEKLSQYQDIRQNDNMKDYLTSSNADFLEICKSLTNTLNISLRDSGEIPNGCQIIAVESDSKWRNAKKMPKLLWFLRVPDMISESTIRSLHEVMKKQNIARGIIVSSSNFSRKAIDFAENRPIDLVNKEKLQEMLQNITL